ncbi:LOW QUALITY PROTEIN: hypothetical protein MXB_2956 [Myxobolus squamalis]|nr:LOW QUALITY PROTEIN: hypothetical protein MXB_2956 [Myxobolus squamalis]
MKERSIEKLLVAKNIAFFISYFIYIVVAACGFVTFGGQPQRYCSNDILINITRLVFTITILLTSPIQLHGCREVIETKFFSKHSKKKFVGPFIIFFLVSVVFIISSLIDDVGTVIEVGGAITNVPLGIINQVYILPALCAIFMYKKNGNEIIWKKIMAWTILMFGLFMLVISPYFSVQSYLEKFNHVPIEKYYCNKD